MKQKHLSRNALRGKVIDVHSHVGVELKHYSCLEYPYAQTAEGIYYQQLSGGVDVNVVFPFTVDLYCEPIDDEALDLLRSFADVVMTHLDNAQLRQELERRIDVLHRYYEMMASLRTTLDRSASLRLVAKTLRDLYQLDTCTFGLLDGESNRLIFETAHQ